MNGDCNEAQGQGQNPVHGQIDKIEKNTNRVDELVRQLEDRLDVVLSPSTPLTASEDKKQSSKIVLVSRLSNINDVTIKTKQALNDILSRLGI